MEIQSAEARVTTCLMIWTELQGAERTQPAHITFPVWRNVHSRYMVPGLLRYHVPSVYIFPHWECHVSSLFNYATTLYDVGGVWQVAKSYHCNWQSHSQWLVSISPFITKPCTYRIATDGGIFPTMYRTFASSSPSCFLANRFGRMLEEVVASNSFRWETLRRGPWSWRPCMGGGASRTDSRHDCLWVEAPMEPSSYLRLILWVLPAKSWEACSSFGPASCSNSFHHPWDIQGLTLGNRAHFRCSLLNSNATL